MSKKAVISLSIVAFLIVLVGVLFGTVFCLRSQSVVIVGDSPISISKEEIISTAGLKNGESIFIIDKDSAINKIEATYPKVKVIQIKTTSVNEIEICVRARHEMCYTKNNNNYFVLDEEFKVLDIIESNNEGDNAPTHLTYIKENTLNINSSTMICDFVGDEFKRDIMSNLVSSMLRVVTKIDNEEEYISRSDICNLIRNVEFGEHSTFKKVILTTKYGVKLDIESPNVDLENKINICFSTIKSFVTSEDSQIQAKSTSGTIKIYYDIDNNQKSIYIAAN